MSIQRRMTAGEERKQGDQEHYMSHQQEIYSLAERLEYIAAQSGIQIQERKDIPGSPAAYAPIPRQLHQSVYDMLAEEYPQGLYSHQARAWFLWPSQPIY